MSDEYKSFFQRLHHLHYIYVIIILLILLVEFIAYYHCDDKELVAEVGFASSVSSIILSVLAIIVTVVANGSTDKLAHGIYRLRDVPAEVRKSVNEAITKISNTTDSLTQASADNTQGIKDMQEKFEGLFREMEQHVEDRLQRNEKNVLQIVSDMQAVNNSLAETVNPSSPVKEEEELSDALREYFFKRLSKAGYVLLYVIDEYLKKELTTPFDLGKMGEIYGNAIYSQYFYGCLVAFISLKVCDASRSSDMAFVFEAMDAGICSKYGENIEKKNLDKTVLMKIDTYLSELASKNADNGEPKKNR